jgi:hypothetical protein
MKLKHPVLVDLLQRAYSAERAAAFAYQGHADSVRDADEKKAIHQIEIDEWHHRETVLAIMTKYAIPISRYYEYRFFIIGKIISASCYVIGRFMPFYFAGRLESGNVCEYFRMKHYFNSLGIKEHDEILYAMGMKEKEHEVYFSTRIENDPLLPFFEKIFMSSNKQSLNNVDVDNKYPVEEADHYCKSN